MDDEKLIRDVIKEYLKLENILFDEAENGYEAIEQVKKNTYDVVVMDIMMPKMDGYQAVKEIRKFNSVPFIMLSARGEEFDKLTCFDIGVDDYVTKPFSPRELIARIKAVSKRNHSEQKIYKFQGLEIDVNAHEVFVDGKTVNLTPKEFDLLMYLVENKNIALSRESLLSNKFINIKQKWQENKNSFGVKTLLSLLLFSLGIVLFLWLFQILFLQVSYEHYQMKKINNIITEIKKTSSEKLDSTLQNLAYENNVCMEFETDYGAVLSYNTMQNSCGLNKNIKAINNFKNQIKYNENVMQGIKLVNPLNNRKAYLYGINNAYGTIYIYSTLEDLDSTSMVLKNQLIYIMLFVLVFACSIAYFLSKKITKPIVGITKKAREMGKGNYDLVFPETGTAEIDELAKTLNNACKDMKKIEELRRDLLANVSHDLKTPLTMIKAYAEMVRDISYKDSLKREKDLNVIIEETDRLTILVNDLLELSKLEASMSEQRKLETYDLGKEIQKIMEKYDIIKETENYNFILDIPDNIMVKAEKNKINQVIYNLINNAINYTGKDKVVKVKVSEKKDTYLVEIIDSGKGIKTDDLPYIWDKYYKNDRNHTRNVVGTGIGLSIVRNILEQHKFKYGVKSKKNKGTTFYFEINKK